MCFRCYKAFLQLCNLRLNEPAHEIMVLIAYANSEGSDETAHPEVNGHFVPRSFRTQVVSYHRGHFVSIFIFKLIISYPVWSLRTSLVISYLLLLFSRKPCWSFRTYFLLFRTQVISYPKSFHTRSHFVPILVISFPGHFVPTSKLGTN